VGGLTTFDRLFDEAAPLIRHGRHERDSPPIEPGGRWPVTVVIRPDQAAAARLEQVMVQVETYAGPGHFRTGVAASVHFTVRPLERYREAVGAEERGQVQGPAQGRAR
jgi:tRNA(Ile2) C34 agmatinyltransferase TiaS